MVGAATRRVQDPRRPASLPGDTPDPSFPDEVRPTLKPPTRNKVARRRRLTLAGRRVPCAGPGVRLTKVIGGVRVRPDAVGHRRATASAAVTVGLVPAPVRVPLAPVLRDPDTRAS